MSGNLTFVPYPDSSERSSRRVRSRRACSRCRLQKRRCNHRDLSHSVTSSSPSRSLAWMGSHETPQSQSQAPAASGPGPRRELTSARDPSASPSGQQSHAGTTRSQNQADQPQNHLPPQESEAETHNHTCGSDTHASPLTTRFVGDLNPEARLLDKTTTPEDAQNMAPGEVGVWVQPHPCSKCASGVEECSPSRPHPPSTGRLSRFLPPGSDMLSGKTIKALSEIYFNNIHPMIPLLNEEQYWQSLSRGTAPVPLVHVLCLVAAKDAAAEKHLKLLQSRDTPLSAREFCSQLYTSLSAALTRRASLGKITLMRILGLLSLHQEGSEGMEGASSCIAQAVHNAQSIALHLPRPNDTDNGFKRLFWCLWTLDRMNAATNSRPCIMADIDIGVPEITPEESNSVAFDVCFRIAKMLNKAIGLYRPNNKVPTAGWDLDYPGFEQIMDEMHAWNLPSATIATLHVFYRATAILAHRLKTVTTLPSPTAARLRQQLSAIQLIRYMQDPTRLNSLHPFPIIVYAASLALSVSYQQLRYSRLPSDQGDARQDFNTGCEILQELRRKWASADAMASLAYRISIALDQLPNLGVLWVNRSNRTERDSHPPSRRELGDTVEEVDHQPHSLDAQMMDRSQDVERTHPELDTMNLFSGMDDVSWMYLDAEIPVNFDHLPLMDFDEPLPW
ncbi:hypothetical protein P170DRAFT_509417 [Aspergillus steynii IBT 23096]|uniref:Xylanolytic transcriptional activator regulatory domain-containing protein n=1 Tax=Aspergillus steynii IBT 23096 TaxID=1392250 RepID=A0A2I2G704_9EURO|nr:uncharacterized protein P170DRAFT_509417 [Aspergillus steynii IBT 23096]PLB48650.1 hypothetical protein P170DRAFT_509417 [Aspergillus steynii IBT 23096]